LIKNIIADCIVNNFSCIVVNKILKKNFPLRGSQLGSNPGSLEVCPFKAQKIYNLKNQLTELEREERLIDTHIKWMKQVRY
jgi:hypothetical protein